jgi:hypothetical protein
MYITNKKCMRIPDGAITDRTIEIINKKSTREGNLGF